MQACASVSQAGVKLRSGRIRSVGARADDARTEAAARGRRKSVDSQNGDKLRSFVRSGAERARSDSCSLTSNRVQNVSQTDAAAIEGRNESVDWKASRLSQMENLHDCS